MAPGQRSFTTKAVVVTTVRKPFLVTVKLNDLDDLHLSHPPSVISGQIISFDQPDDVQRELDREALRPDAAPSARSKPALRFGQHRRQAYEIQISESLYFSGILI